MLSYRTCFFGSTFHNLYSLAIQADSDTFGIRTGASTKWPSTGDSLPQHKLLKYLYEKQLQKHRNRLFPEQPG